MNTDIQPHIIKLFAARDLPARLDVAATAKLLGFADHDIAILMSEGKLVPLGDPAPNAPKWFSAIEITTLSIDSNWLSKATKDIAKYWKRKRKRVRIGRKQSQSVVAEVADGVFEA